jgi:mycothiol system anti-sigma-R factor
MSEVGVKRIECSEAASRLWAYLDGELDSLSAAEVERHLEECGRCFPTSQAQRRFLSLVGDLSADASAVADLRARVEAALRAARAFPPSDEQ